MHAPLAYHHISKLTNKTTDDVDNVYTWPVDENGRRLAADVDYVDTWKAMEDLVKTGKVRSLGVSNFNSEQLDRIISIATIKPVVNQVECHPNLNQRKLIEFAKARNVSIVGYSPLGRPHDAGSAAIAINDPKLKEMAKKYNKNPGQILLRFSYQNDVIVIPKSTNKERLRGNIDIFDFELSKDDVNYLNSLNDNTRLIKFDVDKDNKYYPFKIEF